MALLMKWRATHVKLNMIEKFAGYRFKSLRSYCPVDEVCSVSIKMPRDKWDYYGLTPYLEIMGVADRQIVYIDIN